MQQSYSRPSVSLISCVEHVTGYQENRPGPELASTSLRLDPKDAQRPSRRWAQPGIAQTYDDRQMLARHSGNWIGRGKMTEIRVAAKKARPNRLRAA
jgi:hypothetical protein